MSAGAVPPPVRRSIPARMPSTLSELRARAPANVSIFLIALFSDCGILREHLIHLLEGVARGLGPILTGVGRRQQHRRRAVFRCRERRRRCAATERDGGATGQPLRLDGDCGVIANRRVVHDGDGGDHVLRPVGAERDLRNVADAEAVEQHLGTDFQAGHRALEFALDRCPACRSRLCSRASRRRRSSQAITASMKSPIKA